MGFSCLLQQGKDVLETGESVEYAGKAVVGLALDDRVMRKTGKVLFAADLGEEYKFVDVDGRQPLNYRKVKALLTLSDHSWLAAVTPGFIKIPFWMIASATHKF